MAEHSGLKNRGYTAADVEDRRKAAEEFTGASLETVSKYGFDPQTASKNIENMIGTTQIPLGYAGPVRISGEYADGEFLVPLATTEGALVASISRGMSVINSGGGARTMVCAEGIEHSKRVIDWIDSNKAAIDEAVAETTSHGRLVRIDKYPDGRSLYLRFAFETGDAMGMNMATIASESVCRLIEKETGITGILGDDLYVYSASEPAIWGADGEFFSAPRIDDLMCAWGAVSALSEAAEPSSIAMAALFSSEETGSGSVSGALSDFLPSVMSRLMDSLGMDSEGKAIAISSSFMLSADNGHAVHPAHLDKADPESHPVLNGGVLLKYSAQNKYMTDGETGAYVKMLCQDSGIPFQIFHNHSDIPGGSTLGNLAVEKVSVRGADIGVAQLAMHSPYETAGVRDADHLLRFFSAFYAARR